MKSGIHTLLLALTTALLFAPTRACSTFWNLPPPGHQQYPISAVPNDDTTTTVDFTKYFPKGMPFYGNRYFQMCVSPNGWLYFGPCQPAVSALKVQQYTASIDNAYALASAGAGRGLIAPLFTDLYVSARNGQGVKWSVGWNPGAGMREGGALAGQRTACL